MQSAYERVERDQVADVSKSMTILFSNMVGQTDDGLISEVGLRTTDPASSLASIRTICTLPKRGQAPQA